MPTTHFLKCDAPMFDAIARGDKTFEIRKDDRAYQAGDSLYLERQHAKHETTAPSGGCVLSCAVTFVLRGGQYGIEIGYVGLSIRLIPDPQVAAR